MPSFCVVSNCEFKYVHSPNISFHKFPFHTDSLLRQWIQFTDRGEFWYPSRWSSICSRHFLPNDFRDHVSRKCLKRSAVPSVTIKSLDCTALRLATHVPPNQPMSICRLCARSSIGISTRTRNIDDPTVAAAICKCFPTVRFDMDDILPQNICPDCVSQLNRFATYVDQIVTIQAEFQKRFSFGEPSPECQDSSPDADAFAAKLGISRPFKDLPSVQKVVKIKQEPLVNVKQEYVDSSRSAGRERDDHYAPDSDAFCECCDAYFLNNIELKKHILTFHPGNDTDQAPSSCEIMEIITLGNAFINLAEEETGVNGALELNHTSAMPHSDMIPLEQVLKVEHFNDYEQREQMRLLWIIQDEHSYHRKDPDTDDSLASWRTHPDDDTDKPNLKEEQALVSALDTGADQPENRPEHMSLDTESLIRYQCTECLLQFDCQSQLGQHIESHRNRATRTCVLCSIDFESTFKYLVHKQKVHPHPTRSVYQKFAKTFRCIDCSKRFSTSAALHKHRRLMCAMRAQRQIVGKRDRGSSSQLATGRDNVQMTTPDCSMVNGRYACSLCDRTYGRRSNFNRHFILHRPRDQWTNKCPHCGTLFDHEHDVTVHIRSQKCPVQKLFVLPASPPNRSAPATHSSPHVDAYTIPQCPNVSKTLFRHTQQHVDSQLDPMSCPSCATRFPCADQLREHVLAHRSESKLSCSMCSKVFKRVAGLNQHVNGFHLKIKRHTCAVCKYSYALKGDMKRCRHSRLM